jgi:hypothetical protein
MRSALTLAVGMVLVGLGTRLPAAVAQTDPPAGEPAQPPATSPAESPSESPPVTAPPILSRQESEHDAEQPPPQPETIDIDAELADMLLLVTDQTLQIHRREMPAYWRLVEKIRTLNRRDLVAAARADPRFNDFYLDPATHRGELVQLDLNVRRVLPIGGENGDSDLYELWGWTDEAQAWMYCVVTPSLPPGFPRSRDVKESVHVVGYFFKMQAYHAAAEQNDGRPLVAPLIIGSVEWRAAESAVTAPPINWPMLLIITVAGLLVVRLLLTSAARFSSATRLSHLAVRRRPLEEPKFLSEDLDWPPEDSSMGLPLDERSDR